MATVDRYEWVDTLVPASGNSVISALSNVALTVDGERSNAGPADQALAAVVQAHLGASRGTQHLIVEIPRGHQEMATLIGLMIQIIRAAAWQGDSTSNAAFTGPTVVIGTDTSVQRRLRQTRIRGATLARGLAEGVSACRVRADGTIVTPDGHITQYVGGDRRLLYINTRVGWPPIAFHDAVGVLDRTTLSSTAYETGVDYLLSRRSHHLITVTTIGDDEAKDVAVQAGQEPVTWALSPANLKRIHYVLGPGGGENPMTTNPLVDWVPTWTARPVQGGEEVDHVLGRAMRGLAAASDVEGPAPAIVRAASQLVSTLMRCSVDLSAYSRAAASEPYVRSPRSLEMLLKQRSASFDGRWSAFGTTHWGGLRVASLDLYEAISTDNPKRHAVIDALDRARRAHPTARICLRVPNALTVPLQTQEIEAAGLMDGRIQVHPWSRKLPWRSHDIEIWTGAPSWMHRSHLFSAESEDKHIVLYASEAGVLRRRAERMVERINEDRQGFERWVAPHLLPIQTFELAGDLLTVSTSTDGVLDLGVDLTRATERASDLLARSGESALSLEDAEKTDGDEATTTLLVPVKLADESTWWLHPERAVGVLVHGEYRHRLVSELRVGDQVVVPKGEGRDEIFTRLIQATHGTGDVADLDFLLGRFRKACFALWEGEDHNWAGVKRKLDSAGANAVTQARQWADGSTIAPSDPSDVKLVGELVGDQRLIDGWPAVAAIASEIRSLHIRLGRVLSGALAEVASGENGSNLKKLQQVLGEDGIEALDEFTIGKIASIGEPSAMPVTMDGRVQ